MCIVFVALDSTGRNITCNFLLHANGPLHSAINITSQSHPSGCEVTTDEACKKEMKQAGEILNEYCTDSESDEGNIQEIHQTYSINSSLILSFCCTTIPNRACNYYSKCKLIKIVNNYL